VRPRPALGAPGLASTPECGSSRLPESFFLGVCGTRSARIAPPHAISSIVPHFVCSSSDILAVRQGAESAERPTEVLRSGSKQHFWEISGTSLGIFGGESGPVAAHDVPANPRGRLQPRSGFSYPSALKQFGERRGVSRREAWTGRAGMRTPEAGWTYLEGNPRGYLPLAAGSGRGGEERT
jgi:hypothetical protein